jgi:hypothetical protein
MPCSISIIIVIMILVSSCKSHIDQLPSTTSTENQSSFSTNLKPITSATSSIPSTSTELIPSLSVNINRTTHGRITWNETWRDEIHIDGDILLEKGYTLTIEPGTKVYIAANQDIANLVTNTYEMQQGIREVIPGSNPDYQGVHPGEPFRDEGHHITIRILGTLHAVGTPDKMITITSDSPNPGIYDWNHFWFANGVLSYSIVEYYRVLRAENGTEVSHNILRHVGECAIGVPSSNALIEYNEISYAGHELISTNYNTTSTIQFNMLGPNPNCSVLL